MNTTLKVKTLFDCDLIESYKETYEHDPIWMQTVYGCKLLQVLKDMYKFQMIYVIPDTQSLSDEERGLYVYPQLNDSIDVYAKPVSLSKHLVENSSPIAAIFTWRYGFILKRPYTSILRSFYSLPFTRPVWNYLYLMILLASGVFFYLSRWERRILGGYSSYPYELLLAVGACSQHILPLHANMVSRRLAYLSFIVFTYILHCFYTSNLLSHLVSDKDSSIDLEMLANSDYVCVKLGNVPVPIENKVSKIGHHDTNLSIMQSKLSTAKFMDMKSGLNEVMTTKTALLTDYSAVYPILTKLYETDDICQLIEIDLYSDIKKYFYTSTTFSYKEEFKIGILRTKETGIIHKLLLDDVQPSINCAFTYPMNAEFEQIFLPFCIFIGSCVVATIIMFFERWHYKKYNINTMIWPYVN